MPKKNEKTYIIEYIANAKTKKISYAFINAISVSEAKEEFELLHGKYKISKILLRKK